MKNHILIFFCLLAVCSVQKVFAQLQFFGQPEPISNLNSPNGENYLVLNPHKKGLAFTKEKSNADSTDYGETFFNVFDSTWEATVFLDFEEEFYSPIGYDSDGSLFFSKVVFDKSIYRGQVLVFPEENGISEEVDIPFFQNRSAIQSGCLSKDGRYMILSLESNTSYGVEDLYLVRRKPNGNWESPINLGKGINTAFQEITPHLGVDNRTLFFATNGREGEGSFDIFYTVRQDDSWRSWSTPQNLGSAVNTQGAETSFSFIDGDEWAYYVSSQNSDGYGDIFRIKIKDDIEEDTTGAPVSVAEVVSQEILLKVVDKSSRVALPSVLIVNETPIALPNGLFLIDSSFMLNNEVEIKAQGYLPKIISLDSTLIVGTNEVAMESISVGNTIRLNNVLFHQGTSNMIDGSQSELDLVVEMMNDNPDIKILLKGHTDNQGDPVMNVRLSEDRVKAVRKYLVEQGVNAYRIKGRGYGGNDPIASNESEETRKLNRRVEFEVVEE